jgi:hypothetical protein
MEIMRRYVATQPTRLAAYLALQCALMRRYLARGGTAEDFCERLAPIFHRRYAAVLLAESAPTKSLPTGSPRLHQEWRPGR